MAAHQAPLSLGFSRQEHWSGLPVPAPMHESEKWKWSCSVVSDSSQPHELQPTRLLCPWDFPGKSTGVGCHCLLRATLSSPPQIIPEQRPCFLSTRTKRVVPDLRKRTGIVAEAFYGLVWLGCTSNASVWLEETGERMKKKENQRSCMQVEKA